MIGIALVRLKPLHPFVCYHHPKDCRQQSRGEIAICCLCKKYVRGDSQKMKIYRYFVLAAFAVICFAASQKLHAQISVQIGAAPVCPYGYFDYSPYDCAPYGYYGPEWFRGGVF